LRGENERDMFQGAQGGWGYQTGENEPRGDAQKKKGKKVNISGP